MQNMDAYTLGTDYNKLLLLEHFNEMYLTKKYFVSYYPGKITNWIMKAIEENAFQKHDFQNL